jgi:AcrR family transcriptional regulator
MSFDVKPSPAGVSPGPANHGPANVRAQGGGPERAGSIEWWLRRHELRARRRPRAGGLSLERITAEALRIADAEGADALTMRRLADALGTGIASLYRHVASREELLVEMTDHIFGEFRPPSADSWRGASEEVAWEIRRMLMRHPSVIASFPYDEFLGPNAVRVREIGLSRLIAEGFGPADAVEIYTLLARHVVGSAILDSAAAVPGRVHAQERTRVYAMLPPREYPSMAAISLADHAPDAGRLFQITLRAILDAVEHRYPRAAPAARSAEPQSPEPQSPERRSRG